MNETFAWFSKHFGGLRTFHGIQPLKFRTYLITCSAWITLLTHCPRSTLKEQIYINSSHKQDLIKSFSSCAELIPPVQWFLSLLSAQHIPAPPAHHLVHSHLNGLADLCCPGERPPMIRYVQTCRNRCARNLTIQTFNAKPLFDKHFQHCLWGVHWPLHPQVCLQVQQRNI